MVNRSVHRMQKTFSRSSSSLGGRRKLNNEYRVPTIGVADPRPFPDVILRSQFFEMVGTRSLSSEQRLMLAVLADAINVVQEFGGSLESAQTQLV